MHTGENQLYSQERISFLFWCEALNMFALNTWYIPMKFTQENQMAIMKEVLIPYSAKNKFYPLKVAP